MVEMKAVVTGAAGFIGSHLVDALLEAKWEVVGIDNFATGKREHLAQALRSGRFVLSELDLRRRVHLNLFESTDAVFHLAAESEVPAGLTHPNTQFENNVLATYNVLEAIRKSKVKTMYFTSSSTVYGEPSTLPTPESYCPLSPISIYGSSKLACENLIQGYSKTFGFRSVILRPANVVGKRATHGVIPDLTAKLQKNASFLEILGDGKQRKSYVCVDDVTAAVLSIAEHTRNHNAFDVFNIGNHDRISVTRIAEMLCQEMNVKPALRFSEGVEGGGAWKGDVRQMLLSIEKLTSLGWHPTLNSHDAVRNAIRAAIDGHKPRRAR